MKLHVADFNHFKVGCSDLEPFDVRCYETWDGDFHTFRLVKHGKGAAFRALLQQQPPLVPRVNIAAKRNDVIVAHQGMMPPEYRAAYQGYGYHKPTVAHAWETAIDALAEVAAGPARDAELVSRGASCDGG